MTVVIETRGLTKHFGEVRAVEALDLKVRAGEVFGFLGPNGAGKTTTIRMLLDFVRPTAGRARVLGGSGADTAIRRRIGYLPGELKLDRRYSANDVIDFFGRLRGGVERVYVQSLLGRFELDPDRPAGELSTGNRRKIGIVQAFMHQPELLILDEPTAGLDPLLQQQFLQLVRETAARGATVFLSSHILPEVEALAGRVGILRRGRLVTVATVETLRERARQRIAFHLAGPADASVFRVLPEVVDVAVEGALITVTVEGPVAGVLRAAAKLDVLRVVAGGLELEELFLGYYGGDAT
ncbi:MAG: ABC transporter ATP-binding protein [Tepidiformaceae bacterium]